MDWKTFQDFESILRLPSQLWEQKSILPALPGLYFLVVEDEELVYVGQSFKSIRHRWRNHHLNGKIRLMKKLAKDYGWHQPLFRVCYQVKELNCDAENLKKIEADFIYRFSPDWNTQLVQEKKHSFGSIMRHYST